MSTLPAGTPGIVLSVQSGLRATVKERLGTTPLMTYGPTPGGGLFERLAIFVPLGTKPAAGKARTLRNAPYGCVSSMVIAPVESSALMPEMLLALPESKAA